MADKDLNVLILIPARYDSSRFPGKPLASISGQSMIERVAKNCRALFDKSHVSGHVVVVTDDQRIEKHLQERALEVVRVDDELSSGTERIALAWQRHFGEQKWDYIVNVQGDEPLLEASLLYQLIADQEQKNWDISTLVRPRRQAREGEKSYQDYLNPNKVKAIFSKESGRCFYFSRSPIPYHQRGETPKLWHTHIGVYSYRPQALKDFTARAISHFEQQERLEQLRALEIGLSLGAIETDANLIGVDTPEDIVLVEGVLSES